MLNESISMYLRLRFELKIRKDVEKTVFKKKTVFKINFLKNVGPFLLRALTAPWAPGA